ncbi:hypothetical protein SKAU_G00373370 [Synaphobranchus kaupii]|uniref:ES1 protein n=1 Tax=Synaphobranchus kaupii TaxID=118154 RepID=A0A9Q1IG70_SYNKA|nr:hypothetical protein SKAU_G00373370 [Synaphobranchus kaupii]
MTMGLVINTLTNRKSLSSLFNHSHKRTQQGRHTSLTAYLLNSLTRSHGEACSCGALRVWSVRWDRGPRGLCCSGAPKPGWGQGQWSPVIYHPVQMFAPNMDQMHVVNHAVGTPTEEKRNVLQESARIARGEVTDLSELDVTSHDALIIPGGFGVAKNLSTWATQGKDCSIQPEVEKITVGHDSECEKWPFAQTACTLKEMGCKHLNKNVGEVHVDVKNKLVTTSAFMCNAPIHEVFDGVGLMVTDVLKLA